MTFHNHILKSPSVSFIDHAYCVIKIASPVKDFTRQVPFKEKSLAIGTLEEMEKHIVQLPGFTKSNIIKKDRQ